MVFFLDLKTRKILKQVKKKRGGAILDCSNRKSWLVNQFPDLSKFADAEPLEWKEGQVPPRKDLATIPKFYC